jgi:ABC-type transport system involved in multi-copper enzyme maturation permease subunit
MFPGPVFVHELRAVARRRRSYALRFGFGLFLVYLVTAYARPYWLYARPWTEDGEYSHRELAIIGAQLFASVAWLQAIAVLVLTPALVAGAIGEDRERKVLSYLLASPLSAAEIVLGKLAARLVNLATLILVGLPVVSLALFLGGVDPASLWLGFGATMSGLFFLAALSIFISTFSKRPRDAILIAYLLETLWLFSPPLERALAFSQWIGEWVVAARPVTEYVINTSPMVLMYGNWFRSSGALIDTVSWMIGLQVLYGALLLAWSTLRLRAVERGERLVGLHWLGFEQSAGTRPLRSRRPVGDDPMLWKECAEAFSTGGLGKTAALAILWLAFLAGVGYWVYEAGIPALEEMANYGYGSTSPANSRYFLNTGVRSFLMCLYPLTALFLAVTAATGFTSEKEKDTWTSLVATRLEGGEIIRAKILGAFWRVRGLMAAMLVACLIGLVGGAVHPLGLLLCAVSTAVYAFSFAALGTYVSLRVKSSAQAIATTLGIVMFCNAGYLFCCIPMMNGPGPGSIIVAAGVTPLIVVGSACTFGEFDDFLYGRFPPHTGELVVMGMFSLGFYGLIGLKLLYDCYARFEVEVDRPHKGWWPRSGVSSKGIQFLEEEISDSKDITFLPDEEPPAGKPEGGWDGDL